MQAHIFVSWLHPVKEQKLVVVGSEKMAVFDDTAEHKLVLYPHKVEWKNRDPDGREGGGARSSTLDNREPLRAECQHFLDCVASSAARSATAPRACGCCGCSTPASARCSNGGIDARHRRRDVREEACRTSCTSRPTSTTGAEVGAGTKIWHFSHVMKGARIGERTNIGQNVNVDGGVVIGNNVKIQNNVSVYTGTDRSKTTCSSGRRAC